MLVNSSGMPTLDARDDFRRARRAHLIARAFGRRRASQPRVLDARARTARRPRADVISLSAIVGTVEPSPHFDARFRPASRHLRDRWERIALAHRTGRPLPPIAVVDGGDGYYVVDGRHRVSVAIAAGLREIDARVG